MHGPHANVKLLTRSLPPRVRAQAAKRLMKPRLANIGNPALRNLYLGDTEPYTPPAEELEIPLNERRYIQTLTEISCRWPIGDPQHADFHFCGKSKVTGLPYCEFHARRAFQPPQPRRRDREVHEPLVVVSSAPPAVTAAAEPAPTAAAEPTAEKVAV